MSKINVSYDLSATALKRIAVETGSVPPTRQSVEVDLEALSPDKRAKVLAAPGAWRGLSSVLLTVTTNPMGYMGEIVESDTVLDPDGVIAVIEATTAAHNEYRREQTEKRVQEVLKDILCSIEKRSTWSKENISPRTRDDCSKFGVDTTELDETFAKFEVLLPVFKAEAEAARLAEQAAEEQRKLRAEEKRALAQAEKVAWATMHGSDRLRRSLELECDANRLYLIERAALEYPQLDLDYDRNANWNSRNAAPSLAALDLRDSIARAHPNAEVEIVWLVAPDDFDDLDAVARWQNDDGSFMQHEGIVVHDPAYGKAIVCDVG